MKGAVACVLALVSSVGVALAEQVTTPEEAAQQFYAVYATFHPSDGIPDAKARARYEPVISAGLENRLESAGAAQARFAASNKDAPPLLEGDLFTSNFEGATSWSVGACKMSAADTLCKVALVFDSGNGNKPARWSDTLVMVPYQSGWRVDDIIYGANAAFGNRGRLSETLSQAVQDSGN